jgi:sugar phosphate isomerase/epimerase
MIYISTGGFKKINAASACAELMNAGIKNIELSGGTYCPDTLFDLKKLSGKIKFQIHNYFPPSAVPFVLNLGSLDPLIGERSVGHVENAIKWCSELGADYYSFHAGFLIDPKVDELGRRITNRNLFSREASIEIFVERVKRIAVNARTAGITLMIENNVLSAKNAREFNANPLLMCDPKECSTLMEMMPQNVGLLVDVAHLKVSANSLDYNPIDLLESCDKWITGYHLSDNNGFEDSNEAFTPESWFWPHLKKNVKYYSVEVYDCSPSVLLEQTNIVRQRTEKAIVESD